MEAQHKCGIAIGYVACSIRIVETQDLVIDIRFV